MAERIEPFDVTFFSGTPLAAPMTVATSFDDGIVSALEIDVPPGPSGLVGFKVMYSGVTAIPYASGQFVVADNVSFRWPMHGYGTSGRWSFVGYNTDIFDHTIRVRFLIDEITSNMPRPIQLIPI